MHPQADQIAETLGASGWTIAAHLEPPSWWAADVWQLESTWRPCGLTLFILFLVDPMAPAGAPPADHIWAVALSRTLPPAQLPDRWDALISLGHGWRDRIAELLDTAATLRDNGAA